MMDLFARTSQADFEACLRVPPFGYEPIRVPRLYGTDDFGCEPTQMETEGEPQVPVDVEIQGRSMAADRRAVSQPLNIHDRVRRWELIDRPISFRNWRYKREVFTAWVTCLGRGYPATSKRSCCSSSRSPSSEGTTTKKRNV